MEEGHHDQRVDDREATDTAINDKSDICHQLLDRYGKSSAEQHRHLCATAAATRSIISSESLPLTPLSYFAATISAVADLSRTALDANAVSALSSFLSIVLTLIPEKSIAPAKAVEAVAMLVELLERPSDLVSTASVRALVKSLGVLLEFCDLDDWESVKLGFETLLNFSIDKRPKVRKCAQGCLLKVLKSFESSTVVKEASKRVYSLFKCHLPLAVKLSASRAVDEAKDDVLLNPKHLEVLHMLNVLKHIGVHLSTKISSKVLSQLIKLINSQFSPLTRHIFEFIGALFETSKANVVLPEVGFIIKALAAYLSSEEKNPVDTVLTATTLSKLAFDRLHAGGVALWPIHLSCVFRSIAGLLTSEAGTSSQASNILKYFIDCYIDRRNLLMNENQLLDDGATDIVHANAVESICSVLQDLLAASVGIPNNHILAVISALFLRLGETSYFYLKGILLKLADMIATDDSSDTKHLQECIGSAVIAMGPEKLLTLLPISFNSDDFSSSNIWLLPILKNFVVGSSLHFFMENVVPLAESFQQCSHKAKRSARGRKMLAHANACWGLLPAFCRHPTDTYKNFGRLSKVLLTLLKNNPVMLENVAIALQELVSENRKVLSSREDVSDSAEHLKTSSVKDIALEIEIRPLYSMKTASRNISVLASYSEELLKALTDVLFESPLDKHSVLKDTIQCLASITNSNVNKNLFLSSLKRFELINDLDEQGMLGNITNSVDNEQTSSMSMGDDAKRNLVLDLASSIVKGANEDLINLIFNFIRHTFQESEDVDHYQSYYSLSKVLEEHPWFCSSRFTDLMNLLVTRKAPFDVASIQSRFYCFKTLLIHAIKSSDEDNTRAFICLNELILGLKDSKEEVRKVSYDILLRLGSELQNSSDTTSSGPYHKLVGMIVGYLSGSSPQITSGAVSALSLLIYNDIGISLLMPELVSSVLDLLQSKAMEVIKASLGFVKVLVSCLEAQDLQNFLADILNGVLPWSCISRHHFKSKVTVIVEIMTRKCGSAAVKSLISEKYRNFIKSVLENRHGKTSIANAEPKLSDSSFKGQQRRKDKELGFLPLENSSGISRKKKWEKKPHGKASTTNEPHVFSARGGGNGLESRKEVRHNNHHNHLTGEQLLQRRNHKRKNFNRQPSSGVTRAAGLKHFSKKNESNAHISPPVSSKSHNHRKGKKRQKIN